MAKKNCTGIVVLFIFSLHLYKEIETNVEAFRYYFGTRNLVNF